MEYTAPLLREVGTAQSLVLGVINSSPVDSDMTSSPVLEVLGLDD